MAVCSAPRQREGACIVTASDFYLNQSFTDQGYLEYFSYKKETGATAAFKYGMDSVTGNLLNGFISFTGLTGTLKADGSIKFNPGVGTINFWVEDDGDFN